MNKSCLFLLLPLLVLGACSSTSPVPDHMRNPVPDRQQTLTRLYDRFAHRDAAIGESATKKAASSTERDRRFLVSLWGTRASSAIGGRRYADALSAANYHDEAYNWYRRAFLSLEPSDELRPWLRYEMAYEFVEQNRANDAINLLGNRLGLQPLPAELKPRYAALIDRAGRLE